LNCHGAVLLKHHHVGLVRPTRHPAGLIAQLLMVASESAGLFGLQDDAFAHLLAVAIITNYRDIEVNTRLSLKRTWTAAGDAVAIDPDFHVANLQPLTLKFSLDRLSHSCSDVRLFGARWYVLVKNLMGS
jgi:hypothetical protein